MSWNDPDFAMQFLVGRELALRQKVDTSTATKHSLVASMVSTGMLGPIIARQLAIRDAPAPVVARVSTSTTGGATVHPPPTGPAAAGRVEQIITSFKTWIEEDKKIEAAAAAQAKALDDQVKKMQTDRSEALKKLVDAINALSTDTGGGAAGGGSAGGGGASGGGAAGGGTQQSQQSDTSEGRKGEKKY
jgi:hypothetical protein